MKRLKFCQKKRQLLYAICLILVMHECVTIAILYMTRNINVSENGAVTTRSIIVLNTIPNPAGQESDHRDEYGNGMVHALKHHAWDRITNSSKDIGPEKIGNSAFPRLNISSVSKFPSTISLTKPAYFSSDVLNSTFRMDMRLDDQVKDMTGGLNDSRELNTSETLEDTTGNKSNPMMFGSFTEASKFKISEILEDIEGIGTGHRMSGSPNWGQRINSRTGTTPTIQHPNLQGSTSNENLDTCIANFPLNVNMVDLAVRLLRGEPPGVSIINNHPFEYIHSPGDLCISYNILRRLRLLILVKSAAQNFQLRYVMRHTWGKRVRKYGMEYAFLLGFSPLYQQYVDYEDATFHDVIQESFIDVYRNNTFKTIMGYNWVVKYCSVAERVLFLDDDVYLNVNLLDKYLITLDEIGVTGIFSGSFQEYLLPHRHNTSKWYMPYEDYPCSSYPQFLSGLAILVSMDVVKMFQVIFPYVKYLYTDDVLLAIVAKKLGIKPMRNPYFTDHISNLYELTSFIAAHGDKGFKNPKWNAHIYNELAKFGIT